MSNDHQTVTLNIREYMDYGLSVFDANDNRIGSVYDYNRDHNYMVVRRDGLARRLLYIPYRAITNIDPREVFISISQDDAERSYSNPPPGETVLEWREP